MQLRIGQRNSAIPRAWQRAWLTRVASVALLWACMAGAHAASVYKCVDAHGRPTYRDTPCDALARQTKLDLAGQPLIDPAAPWRPASMHVSKPSGARTRPQRAVASRARKVNPATSWECHATNGEMFYRHTRCPSSVPGDGVMRAGYAEKMSRSRTRGNHDAWSRVPVHGTKITRAEACRRIHAAGAGGRDGHARDETAPTYDRLMGRGPCEGE